MFIVQAIRLWWKHSSYSFMKVWRKWEGFKKKFLFFKHKQNKNCTFLLAILSSFLQNCVFFFFLFFLGKIVVHNILGSFSFPRCFRALDEDFRRNSAKLTRGEQEDIIWNFGKSKLNLWFGIAFVLNIKVDSFSVEVDFQKSREIRWKGIWLAFLYVLIMRF